MACIRFTITQGSTAQSSVERRAGDYAQCRLGRKPLTRRSHDAGGNDILAGEVKSPTVMGGVD